MPPVNRSKRPWSMQSDLSIPCNVPRLFCLPSTPQRQIVSVSGLFPALPQPTSNLSMSQPRVLAPPKSPEQEWPWSLLWHNG